MVARAMLMPPEAEPVMPASVVVVMASLSRGFEMALVMAALDRKSTRLNSSHGYISYAVFCLKKKNPRHRAVGPRAARGLPGRRRRDARALRRPLRRRRVRARRLPGGLGRTAAGGAGCRDGRS